MSLGSVELSAFDLLRRFRQSAGLRIPLLLLPLSLGLFDIFFVDLVAKLVPASLEIIASVADALLACPCGEGRAYSLEVISLQLFLKRTKMLHFLKVVVKNLSFEQIDVLYYQRLAVVAPREDVVEVWLAQNGVEFGWEVQWAR